MTNAPAGSAVSKDWACVKCSYNLRGLSASAVCPECGAAVMDSNPPVEGPPPVGGIVESDRGCLKCSYNLKGLSVSGVCPECGSPVADSLRGILLQFASREYVEKVNSGLSIVLSSILLTVVMMVGLFVFTFWRATSGPRGGGATYVDYNWIGRLVTLGLTAMSLAGYMRFTAADPGLEGLERPDSARKVLRIAVVVQIGIAAVQLLTSFVPASAKAGAVGELFQNPWVLLGMLLSLGGLVAWAVGFFATMNYTAWMGLRIPDAFLVKRAKTYRWVLPIVYVVGFSCLGIGPLVTLVLYWNLLDRLRKHTKSILAKGQPAALKGMAA